MSKLVCVALACGLSLIASRSAARPVFLHETEHIVVPPPYRSASHVCLHGNHVLALAHRSEPERAVWALIHFERQPSGEWRFVEEVLAARYDDDQDLHSREGLDCDGPLAAMSTPVAGVYVAELAASRWTATRLEVVDHASRAGVRGDAVAFATNSRSPVTIAIVRKNGAGQWADVSYAIGNPGDTSDFETAGPHDFWFTDTQIAVHSGQYSRNQPFTETVSDTQVFDLVNGEWRLTTLPDPREGAAIGDDVALLLDTWTEPGEVAAYFSRDGSGEWAVKHSLLSAERWREVFPSFHGERAFAFVWLDQGAEIDTEIAIFGQEGPRRYRHEATLNLAHPVSPATSFSLGGFSVDGERVAALALDGKTIYLFDAPSTLPAPVRLEHTFEDNSVADWMVWGKTNWRVVSAGGSRVFRQHKTEGDARAILQTFEGADQSIQADVRIHSLVGSTPWAGFMLRYTDPGNFYYLLVNRNSVQIRRIVNGVFGPIARAPFELVLGRMYRFRMEAIGTRIRAYVNGELMAEAVDETHPSGKAGLTMWRAVTDYDNVVVTSSPQGPLFADTFSETLDEQRRPWTSAPTNAWTIATSSGERVYRQGLASGAARAINGGPTQDQIVSARVRPRAFNANRKGFAGLAARYVDASNYYYAVLTDADTASLRKVVNGVVTVLEEAPMTVSNTTYLVRIEAIGASVRMYVNGRLMAEGQDDALPTGQYGLLTEDAAADFDNFTAIRP